MHSDILELGLVLLHRESQCVWYVSESARIYVQCQFEENPKSILVISNNLWKG